MEVGEGWGDVHVHVQYKLSLRTPLYYGKADTWFCPFGVRIKEV